MKVVYVQHVKYGRTAQFMQSVNNRRSHPVNSDQCAVSTSHGRKKKMTVKFKNNNRVSLTPFYTDDVSKALDNGQLIKNAVSIIEPVYSSGKNVTAADENGDQVTPDMLAGLILVDAIEARIKYELNKTINDIW